MSEVRATRGQGLDGGPPEQTNTARARRRPRQTRLVVTGIALAVLLWFAFANLQRVSIRFWLTTTSAPLIVVIVISGFLGAAASGLWSLAARRRRRDGTGS
jgi:uncharacterized integral membrane protein